MARPTTKEDLIIAGNGQYKKLVELICSISEADRLGTFNFDLEKEKEAHWKRDKCIRDVLIHVYEWQQLLLNWVQANQNDESKPFLLDGYNWKTYGEMNVKFWEAHQETSYEQSVTMLEESHGKVMKLIETFSNEELFSKGSFAWTGGSTLGSYCVSVTASHYDWAMKKLKKYKKGLN